MNKIYLYIFLFAIISNASIAQDYMALEDAISYGLENNFNIKLAAKDREIAYNNYRRGNAGFLPSITLGAGRNYSNQNVTQVFIDGNENSRDGAKSNTWSGDAFLNWTVFDGLRMFKAYDRLGQQRDIGDLSQRYEIEINVQDIIVAYYRVILEKNAVSALDSNLDLSRSRVNQTQIRYELGKVPKLDYLSARVDFNADSSALIRQLEALQKAKNGFNNTIARPIDIEFETPDVIPLDSTLELNSLLEEAQFSYTNLNRLRKDISVAELQSKEIFAERIPSLGVNLGYSYNKFTSEAGFLSANNARGVNYGFTASWTVFQGTNITRRYQNALIEKESAEIRVEEEKLNVERAVRDTYLEYQNSLALVRLEQLNLAVALENTTIAIDRYNLGKSTFLALREAQVNAVTTYGRLITAIFNTKVAEIELLRLSGRLLDSYNIVTQ